MPGKSVQLSVRISEADATFLAGLNIPGAVTPSDKLRALIGEARRRYQETNDYGACLSFLQDLVGPVDRKVLSEEKSAGVHSALVTHILHWLPETTAFALAGMPDAGEAEAADPADALRSLEAGLADRVFSLTEETLRMGVTSRNPCYDPNTINQRIEPVLELSNVLKSSTAARRGSGS